jgi:hypothetical protein
MLGARQATKGLHFCDLFQSPIPKPPAIRAALRASSSSHGSTLRARRVRPWKPCDENTARYEILPGEEFHIGGLKAGGARNARRTLA